MSEVISERLSAIDVNFYIDAIQGEIAKTIIEVGTGKTQDEVDKGISRLFSKLAGLSGEMARQIGVSEDYNIVLMMASTVVSLSWTAFILKAKSLHPKRSIEERTLLKAMLDALQADLPLIMSRAVKYGAIYDKNQVDIADTIPKETPEP